MTIELSLRALAASAWRDHTDPAVYKLARGLTDRETTRQQKMRALVEDMHRRFRFPRTADPAEESLTGASGLMDLPSLDADDACVLLAALAMSVGIRCRLVAVRYGLAWTCWVSFEVGNDWEVIDPLRQRPPREPDETVMGPMPEEAGGE